MLREVDGPRAARSLLARLLVRIMPKSAIVLALLVTAAVVAGLSLTNRTSEPEAPSAPGVLSADTHAGGEAPLPAPPMAAPEALTVPEGEPALATESPEPPPTIEPVLPHATLIVQVRRGNVGAPAPGAQVLVTSTDPVEPSRLLGEERGRTDNAGECRLKLPLGSLSVVAWTDAREYGEARLQLDAESSEARVVVELGAFTSVWGIVRDVNGAPIEGVAVTSGASRAIGREAVRTDAAGTFEFDDWKVGVTAMLAFERVGYGSEHLTLNVREDGNWCLVGMSDARDWRSGQPFVEVRMPAEKVVRGMLTDAAGQPVGEGRVRASGIVESSSVLLMRDEAEARSTDDGRFELRGLRSDIPHFVQCDATGLGAAARSAPSGEPAVDLGTIQLSGAGEALGRIVDRWGRPLGGALVRLVLEDASTLVRGPLERDVLGGPSIELVAEDRVAPDGRFSVAGPSVKGLSLQVLLGSRKLWEGEVDLRAGAADLGELRVEHDIAGFAAGRLLDEQGRALGHGHLDVVQGRGRLWARPSVQADGSFEFPLISDAMHPRVTLVLRDDERGPAVSRWTLELERFPAVLRVR